MGYDAIDRFGSGFVESLRSECQRLAGINHVVYQNRDLGFLVQRQKQA